MKLVPYVGKILVQAEHALIVMDHVQSAQIAVPVAHPTVPVVAHPTVPVVAHPTVPVVAQTVPVVAQTVPVVAHPTVPVVALEAVFRDAHMPVYKAVLQGVHLGAQRVVLKKYVINNQ